MLPIMAFPSSGTGWLLLALEKDIDAKWSFPKATHSKEALLYSKWITGDYWEQHKLLKPSESPLSKKHGAVCSHSY